MAQEWGRFDLVDSEDEEEKDEFRVGEKKKVKKMLIAKRTATC